MHNWMITGVALKAPSPAKFGKVAKFTKENCGIQLPSQQQQARRLEPLHVVAPRGSAPVAGEQQSRPFLSKLSQRLASAVKPRRNASE